LAGGTQDVDMQIDNPDKSNATKVSSRWARAGQIAEAANVSRALVYPLAKRWKIPSVSLAEPGKVGVRLFRIDLFLAAIDKLAEAQRNLPFPHNRGHKKIEQCRTRSAASGSKAKGGA
jgi:hypothetical protein